MRRLQWAAVCLGSALSLFVSLAIAKIWFVVGSEEGHWVHQYALFFDVRAIWIAMLVAALAAALLALPESIIRRREWLIVLTWFVAALALQALLRSLTGISFEQNLRSVHGYSFYVVTQRYPARVILSDFERLRPELPLHAQSNMPGKLIFMYALELITNRADVLPWLITALSNFGGVLMYMFVRDFFGNSQVALYSLVLYLFLPAKLYFLPGLNTVTPVIVLLCVVLLMRWLRTSRMVYAALLGAALYELAFFDPGALSMGLLMAVLMAHALWRRDIAWRTLLLQGSMAVGVFAATYLVVLIWFRFDLFTTARQLGIAAAGFNDRWHRPYKIWVRQNLLNFFFGVGICQTVLVAVAPWRRRITDPIVILCVTITAILLVVDAIGISRGEVVRLWIFLACFFQIPAAYVCARLESRAAMMVVIATTVIQAALGTLMIGFIYA